MATFWAMEDNFLPSSIILSKSVAVTSALTGPETSLQISSIVSIMFLPDLAIKDGFVVTPSINPVIFNDFISSISAVSINSSIIFPL